MLKRNIYIDRLALEWNQHGKIIIAVDYDSTILPWSSIDNRGDIERAIKLIREAQLTGAYIVIFTASTSDRHPEIIEYCKSKGIEVDSINSNPIELPVGYNGKIFYNINLCDRSGFTEAMDILESALYLQRSKLNSDRHNYPGALG